MSRACRVDSLRIERDITALGNVADDDLDVADAIRPGVRLRWLAPASVEQDSDACKRADGGISGWRMIAAR